MRFIYKCFLTARAGHYTMTCRPMSNSNGKQRVLTFHGSKEWMRTQLLRMKANDKVVDPPSKNRSKIYMQMIDDAEANRDNTIFVWSNLLPKDNSLKESFFESKSSAKDWVARLTEMPHFMVKNEPYDLELELHTKDSENDLRSYLKKLVKDSPKELKDEIISSNIIKLFITNKFDNDAYQRIMKDL